jgi:serine protease
MVGKSIAALVAFAGAVALSGACALPARAGSSAGIAEYNRVRSHPVSIGAEANRLIVGFRATSANAVVQAVNAQSRSQPIRATQARTSPADVAALAQRVHLPMRNSRQLTPSMHVMVLDKALYGSAVAAALQVLRADPAVAFADVDQRRYPQALPNDPLFEVSANARGQWYMMTPSFATDTSDAAATDAVSAWNLATGNSGIVIADIDTGVRFDHPDLLRAGFGGRLLPGYDFVGGDLTPAGAELGTYLIANDGDGWDPDPSDPGDWINVADQSNSLFPSSDCAIADSSWHGTRVMGIMGALTNNSIGIAGMTWQSYLLPVRALGKCGGYDSDIITGMQWAAGLPVTGVPDNPFPAQIINLSLGGSGACPSDYATAVTTLASMGVLIVASAGNESGPVDAPGNCPGVLAVAGLRNVGTKVGYSSLGAEVGIAAPAGNCVNVSGPCLRSIDTTTNTGLTVPADSTYTNETNPNLGTSFSAPIVSGIAALMRSVNTNLTPAQLIGRLKSSAVAFPQPVGVPVCPASETDSSGASTGLCACPNDGSQCGAGMVNALDAVDSALRPIAAVAIPAAGANGVSTVIDAGGSAASCGRSIASTVWTSTGGSLPSGANASTKVTVTPTGNPDTITLTVTDSAGAVDTAQIAVSAAGAIIAAPGTPASAGTSASACPASLSVAPVAPVVTAAFSPASVGENVASTLTITLDNANGFDLTQSSLTETLPAGMVMATHTSSMNLAPGTTCTGAASSLTTTTNTVILSNANIPTHGSCVVTVPLQSATAGTYTNTLVASALTTGPAGTNSAASIATLTVTAPSGGGGEVDWWDTLFVVGVILAGRRGVKRKPPR